MSRQVLLVGLESTLTKGRGALRGGEAQDIELIQTGNATQALEFVDQNPVDVLMAALDLPDMSGSRLLDLVFQRNPSVHRFLVLDPDQPNPNRVPASIAHFLIRPPLVPGRFAAALERADQLADWFGPGFATQVLSRLRKIPSPPLAYYRALSALDAADASTKRLMASIHRFPRLAACLVDMVNTTTFQPAHPARSVEEVVRLLGVDASASLVLVAHLFCQFNRISPHLFPVSAFCRHALATGRLARALARAERCSEDTQQRAFLAGLLHDAGKLLLAANAPDTYARINAEVRFGYRSFTDVERDALGMSHAEVGAWLASAWDLPMEVVAALAFHHEPRQLIGDALSVPQLVYAANVLVHQTLQDLPGGQVPQLDESFLLNHGQAGRVRDWSRLAAQLFESAERPELETRSVAA